MPPFRKHEPRPNACAPRLTARNFGRVRAVKGAPERRDSDIRNRGKPTLRGNLIGRYYDPATGQFLSVDPLVDETRQPYAYTGDDPVNDTDPIGAVSAGTICGMDGLNSQACRGAIQIQKTVGKEVAENQVSGGACIIDVAGNIGNWSTDFANWVAANHDQLISGVGVLLATASIAIDGPLGVEADEFLAPGLAGSTAQPFGFLEVAKGATGGGAIVIDTSSCFSHPNVESCSASYLGEASLFSPVDEVDHIAAWILSTSRFVSTGGHG
jgi:RHS repeat-associated protein